MSEVNDGEVQYVSERDVTRHNHRFVVHTLEHAQWKARLATALVEKWGMVAMQTDGEDSSGRQKGRLLSPREIVERACDTADLAVETFRSRDWVTKIPPLEVDKKGEE